MKLTEMLNFAEYAQESHICIIPLETDFVLLLYSTWVFLLLSVLKSKLFLFLLPVLFSKLLNRMILLLKKKLE